MTKIILGQKPSTFKPFPVKFEMPDGSTGVITATFKYRTRSEFGAMLNTATEGAGQVDVAPDGKLDYEKLHRSLGDRNAEHLLACIHAWDLDDQPLSLETLQELSDTLPAGAIALMSAYAGACTEGRLGN